MRVMNMGTRLYTGRFLIESQLSQPLSGRTIAIQSFSLQTNGFPDLRRLLAKRNLNLLVATANSIHNRTEHLDPAIFSISM
jgi:hypothetical protein